MVFRGHVLQCLIINSLLNYRVNKKNPKRPHPMHLIKKTKHSFFINCIWCTYLATLQSDQLGCSWGEFGLSSSYYAMPRFSLESRRKGKLKVAENMFQCRTGPTEQREQKAVGSAPSHFAGSKCSVLCPLPSSTMAAFPVLEQETLFRNGTWSYRIPALLYLPRFSMILAFAEEREDPMDEHAKLIVMRRGMYNPATQHVQVPVQGGSGGHCPSSAHLLLLSWMYLPSCCRNRAASPPQVQETNLAMKNAHLLITAGIQPYRQLLGGLKWSRYSRGGFDPSLQSWGCRYRDGTKVLL